MPRDGSSIYHIPPGTQGIPDTTIESAKYNGFCADIEQDLNLPRPIVAGGTGASDARTAMINLGGEIASQLVDNYDSFPFAVGSFYSVAGATSAPVAGHAFTGVVYGKDASNLIVEARDTDRVAPLSVPLWANLTSYTIGTQVRDSADNRIWQVLKAHTTGAAPLTFAQLRTADPTLYALAASTFPQFIREKKAGVWGAWVEQNEGVTDLDARYVNVAGDTMTGTLNVAAAVSGTSIASAATATTGSYYFGSSGTKVLSYDGTSYTLAGGTLNVSAAVSATSIVSAATATVGAYYFGSSGTKVLSYDGTSYTFAGGNLSVIGAFGTSGAISAGGALSATSVASAATATTGTYYFGNSGTKTLSYDGTAFNLVGGGLATNGIYGRQGIGGVQDTAVFNFYWATPGVLQAWINTSNVGNVSITSDYRIKKDVIDLPGMWDTVKALRPIKYTQAQFSPPSHVKYVVGEIIKARAEAEENPEAKPREVSTAPMFEADDVERWGFIAHELQEVLTPSAATGVKDAPDTIQSPNPFTVIAALTKALQEAMARIEALEAR